jgi:hypothetical protein
MAIVPRVNFKFEQETAWHELGNNPSHSLHRIILVTEIPNPSLDSHNLELYTIACKNKS